MNETYSYLYSLEKYGILLGLDNIKILLSLIDNPQNKFKSIHIVGTNGKGSTASFINSILINNGYNTGLYTSPHLINFSERITISGKPIPESDIERLAHMMKTVIAQSPYSKRPFTFFEVTTAMAFQYFAEQKVDIAIIEAGLGGRLDATNTINPLATVITTIGLEHKEFLGNTLEDIAFEKASVIKENTPCVTGVKDMPALKVIKDMARSKKAPLYEIDKHFSCLPLSKYEFSYNGIKMHGKTFTLERLIGKNQFYNASVAIAVAELLQDKGFQLTYENIYNGIKNTYWPGRFEIIRHFPPFIIDGAHNPQGIDSLTENLKTYFPENKFKIILTVLKDKDIFEMVKKIMPFASEIVLVPNKNERSYKIEELKEMFKDNSIFSFAKNIPSVIKECIQSDKPILLTGSLYGIGEAKEALKHV